MLLVAVHFMQGFASTKYLTFNMVLPDGVFSCLESFSELTVICANHRCSSIRLLSLEIVIDISSERVTTEFTISESLMSHHMCHHECQIINMDAEMDEN